MARFGFGGGFGVQGFAPIFGSESRNFTTSNLGGSEYWPLDSSVSHTGDFIESRKISTTSTAAGTLFSGGTAAGKLEVSLTAAGLVQVDVAGVTIFTGVIAVNDGKLNEIVLSRTGTTASLTVNGVSDGSGTMSGTVAYDTFNARTGGTIFFIGVQADIISNDAGTDVHSWPIDEEDPSEITDRVGSNDSTAANFTSNDSETFTKSGDDWVSDTEEIINGDFATDTAWSKTGSSTISGGKGNVDAGLLIQAALTNGVTYLVECDITDFVSGGQQGIINNDAVNLYSITTNEHIKFVFTHTIASGNFIFRSTSPGTYSVDDVTVKRILEGA